MKKQRREAEVHFLCKKGLEAIPNLCEFIDHVHIWDETDFQTQKFDVIIHVFPNRDIAHFFKKWATYRIGTTHRWYHWYTCNKLVALGRKNSSLHESELNMSLLKPLGIDLVPLKEIYNYYGLFNRTKEMNQAPFEEIDTMKFNLILHMKSRGSSKEWDVLKFLELAKKLPKDKFKMHITGTSQEGDKIKKEVPELASLPNVNFTTGKFNLKDFIRFIHQCDGILAASTGPLHIASALGIHVLGLYPFKAPMYATRWAPIGKLAQTLSEKKNSKEKHLEIDVENVSRIILSWV